MEPLRRLGGAGLQGSPAAAPPRVKAGTPDFGSVLGAELNRQAKVSLSGHAQVRFDQRDLHLDAPALQRLGTALDKAQLKGVRTSVIMLDGMAMVANVPDRRIITALNAAQAKDKVFTNIDGVVIA